MKKLIHVQNVYFRYALFRTSPSIIHENIVRIKHKICTFKNINSVTRLNVFDLINITMTHDDGN